jgi:hypothetical protein
MKFDLEFFFPLRCAELRDRRESSRNETQLADQVAATDLTEAIRHRDTCAGNPAIGKRHNSRLSLHSSAIKDPANLFIAMRTEIRPSSVKSMASDESYTAS